VASSSTKEEDEEESNANPLVSSVIEGDDFFSLSSWTSPTTPIPDEDSYSNFTLSSLDSSDKKRSKGDSERKKSRSKSREKSSRH
jgi:hypothetical protein